MTDSHPDSTATNRPSDEANSERAAAAVTVAPVSSAPAPGRTRHRPSLKELFVSFENRDFRYLSLSSLALGVGQWAQQIGLPWLAFQLTGHATAIGGVSAVQGGIGILTAPLAGYLADRYPRRAILVWSTLASAVQALVLAALAFSPFIQLWHVYALALAGGALQSMAQPARQSFVYDVSTDETLVNAVAMNSIVQNFARIASPPLAGVLIGFWGTGAAFAILAATRIVAVLFTHQISSRTRQVRTSGGRNPIGQMIEGFTVTWRDTRVLGLVVVHSIPTFLVIPYLPYLSVLARDVYHKGAASFGLMNSMVGTGAVCGLFVLALLGDPRRKGLIMLSCFVAYAFFVLMVFTSQSFSIALGALLLVGLVNSVAFALNNTLIQLAAPNEARGRVMSVWQLSSGLQPLGALPMGYMIDRFGVAYGMGGFMTVAVAAFALFAAFWPSVRKM